MNLKFWNNKRVLITGGTGFIGSHLTEYLYNTGAILTVVSRSEKSKLWKQLIYRDKIEYLKGDLQNQEFVDKCTRNKDIVFHFASKIAGLGYNSKHPAEMMAYNLILDMQVLNAAAKNNVNLFFYPSGALVYDHDVPTPISEEASSSGKPVEACQGASWAKRASEIALPFFFDEYGMKSVIARFCNLYGPGDDINSESAHLIGNIIRLVANDESPEIWGDGTQLRSYLYISDAIEAIVCLAEEGINCDPINIGGTMEYSVKDIVNLIVDISGKPSKATFHPDCPCGLNRKILNLKKIQKLTGLQEKTTLRTGLQKTYKWYLSYYAESLPNRTQSIAN